MAKVGIVFFTKTDVTGSLAKAIQEGVSNVDGAIAKPIPINGSEILEGRYRNEDALSSLAECDAIVFGSPTYMGGASAQFKAFADATGEIWSRQEWSDKIAAGFTCGSGINGDQSSTLQYFLTFANQHGMIWVGIDSAYGYTSNDVNRFGCHSGVVAHSPEGKLHLDDLSTARYLGQRVAEKASRLAQQ